MKKNLLIGLIVFLSMVNTSFANCCPQGLTATNGQKACQNIFAFFAIDFSFLSPRATAADVHVCGKHRFNKCCNPCESQCDPDSQCCPCPPQCPPCQPQCCPSCQPKYCPCPPQYNRQSMVPTTDKKEIPVCNKKTTVSEENKNEIPISNKQITKKPGANHVSPKNQKSMFRLDLFRTFKVQIL